MSAQNIKWEEFKKDLMKRLTAETIILEKHKQRGGTVDLNFVGDVYKQAFSGSFNMTQRTGNYGDAQTIQRGSWNKKQTTLTDYTLVVALNDFEQALVQPNLYKDNLEEINRAVDKRKDMVLIDGLAASTYSGDGEQFVSGIELGTTANPETMGMALLKKIKLKFSKNNVRKGVIVFLNHDQFDALLNDDEFINNDYLKNQHLATGEITDVLGLHLVIVDREYNKSNPTQLDYGLPEDTVNDQDILFAYSPAHVHVLFGKLESNNIIKHQDPSTFDTIVGIGCRGGVFIKNEAATCKIVVSR